MYQMINISKSKDTGVWWGSLAKVAFRDKLIVPNSFLSGTGPKVLFYNMIIMQYRTFNDIPLLQHCNWCTIA